VFVIDGATVESWASINTEQHAFRCYTNHISSPHLSFRYRQPSPSHGPLWHLSCSRSLTVYYSRWSNLTINFMSSHTHFKLHHFRTLVIQLLLRLFVSMLFWEFKIRPCWTAASVACTLLDLTKEMVKNERTNALDTGKRQQVNWDSQTAQTSQRHIKLDANYRCTTIACIILANWKLQMWLADLSSTSGTSKQMSAFNWVGHNLHQRRWSCLVDVGCIHPLQWSHTDIGFYCTLAAE